MDKGYTDAKVPRTSEREYGTEIVWSLASWDKTGFDKTAVLCPSCLSAPGCKLSAAVNHDPGHHSKRSRLNRLKIFCGAMAIVWSSFPRALMVTGLPDRARRTCGDARRSAKRKTALLAMRRRGRCTDGVNQPRFRYSTETFFL
jgi:hypothetical protein